MKNDIKFQDTKIQNTIPYKDIERVLNESNKQIYFKPKKDKTYYIYKGQSHLKTFIQDRYQLVTDETGKNNRYGTSTIVTEQRENIKQHDIRRVIKINTGSGTHYYNLYGEKLETIPETGELIQHEEFYIRESIYNKYANNIEQLREDILKTKLNIFLENMETKSTGDYLNYYMTELKYLLLPNILRTIFTHVGEGISGKGTLYQAVLTRIFGEESVEHFTNFNIFKKRDASSFQTEIGGKITLVFDEIPGDELNPSMIKTATNGFMEENPKYLPKRTVTCPTMFWLGNETPNIPDGISLNTRICEVLHNSSIPSEHKYLVRAKWLTEELTEMLRLYLTLHKPDYKLLHKQTLKKSINRRINSLNTEQIDTKTLLLNSIIEYTGLDEHRLKTSDIQSAYDKAMMDYYSSHRWGNTPLTKVLREISGNENLTKGPHAYHGFKFINDNETLCEYTFNENFREKYHIDEDDIRGDFDFNELYTLTVEECETRKSVEVNTTSPETESQVLKDLRDVLNDLQVNGDEQNKTRLEMTYELIQIYKDDLHSTMEKATYKKIEILLYEFLKKYNNIDDEDDDVYENDTLPDKNEQPRFNDEGPQVNDTPIVDGTELLSEQDEIMNDDHEVVDDIFDDWSTEQKNLLREMENIDTGNILLDIIHKVYKIREYDSYTRTLLSTQEQYVYCDPETEEVYPLSNYQLGHEDYLQMFDKLIFDKTIHQVTVNYKDKSETINLDKYDDRSLHLTVSQKKKKISPPPKDNDKIDLTGETVRKLLRFIDAQKPICETRQLRNHQELIDKLVKKGILKYTDSNKTYITHVVDMS